MPIRPENRARYPDNWNEISFEVRRRANFRCQECGVKNGELGGRDPGGKWHRACPTGDNGLRLTWPEPGTTAWCETWPAKLRIVRVVLTVAHLDHTPENCADANLRAWCQRCHNRHDTKHRRAGIAARARAGRADGDLFAEEST